MCLRLYATQAPSSSCITFSSAPDKTVQCSDEWSFDSPTNIMDACCSNYAVIYSTVTNNGLCPSLLTITRTWSVSDVCGDSNGCSQTVTVDAVPPIFTSPAGPGNGGVVRDQFFVPDPVAFEDGISTNDSRAQTFTVGLGGILDHVEVYIFNQAVPPNTPQDLIFELRGTVGGVPDPNTLYATITLPEASVPTALGWFSIDVSSFQIAVTPGQVLAIVLAQAPGDMHTDYSWVGDNGYTGGTSYSKFADAGDDWIEPGGDLGFKTYVSTGGCPTNKTVLACSIWDFDTPTAFDPCAGTNVPVTVLDTLTNDSPDSQMITRTWVAATLCGSTDTCSQTVTVVQNDNPIINCPANITINADTNGCGLMPDETTNQILVTGNIGAVSVMQSIPPGTMLCSDTNVTLTVVNACGYTNFCTVNVILISSVVAHLGGPYNNFLNINWNNVPQAQLLQSTDLFHWIILPGATNSPYTISNLDTASTRKFLSPDVRHQLIVRPYPRRQVISPAFCRISRFVPNLFRCSPCRSRSSSGCNRPRRTRCRERRRLFPPPTISRRSRRT